MRYPNATFKPLGPQTEPRMTAHDIVCVHTMVDSLVGCDRGFRAEGFTGKDAHYGVGGKWGEDADEDLDGVVWQWQEREFQTDSNLEGNPRVIPIETADNAPATAARIKAWTPRQVDALVALIAWECSLDAHAECPRSFACRQGTEWRGMQVAIPPELVADSKSSRRGLAMHRQGVKHSQGFGVAGFLVRGGELWSESVGKECPGDVRAAQFVDEIIPAVQRRVLDGTGPDVHVDVGGDEDMTGSDVVRLGPGSSIVLGQPDHQLTYAEAIALQTAATVQRVQVLELLVKQQREFNEALRRQT